MPLTFEFRDLVLTERDLLASAGVTKPKSGSTGEPKHRGFAVVGYRPGEIAAAESVYKKLATTDAAPWNLDSWLRRNRPHRAGKPVATPQGAEELAGVATRSGWEFVDVVPLISGLPKR